MIIITFFIAQWYLSLFAQSFFHHRYASHNMFSMSKGWQKFFYIYSFITQGSSYLSPRAYAIMHRLHHAYADTEKDPHSPKNYKSLLSMVSGARRYYNDIFFRRMEVPAKYEKNLPVWESFDQMAGKRPARVMWVLIYTCIYALWAPSAWFLLLLPFQVAMTPTQGIIINWFGHIYGSINFKQNNTSKNLTPIDLFMLGEAYHNNHHKFPGSANFGYKWYEFDPIWWMIKMFNRLGVVRLHTA